MNKKNNFSTSYGLIIITKEKNVVIIRRKIPYCVQNFLIKNKNLTINNYIEPFMEYFKTMESNMKFDYFNFVCNLQFEDEFDFPHGQLDFTTVSKIIQVIQNKKFNHLYKNKLKYHTFMTALREFKEETGYYFKFTSKIKDIPIKTIEFTGLDNCFYKQTYFIIKVDRLEKAKNSKLEQFYEPLVLNICDALKLFKKQQKVKFDGKDLILSRLL